MILCAAAHRVVYSPYSRSQWDGLQPSVCMMPRELRRGSSISHQEVYPQIHADFRRFINMEIGENLRNLRIDP